MAGGQERALRRRIKSRPVHEEDHPGHGADLGSRGSSRPSSAVAAARPYSEQHHRRHPQPVARRCRHATMRCCPSATTCARSAFVVVTADRGLAVATTRSSSGPPSASSGRLAAGPELLTDPASARRRADYFRFRNYDDRRLLHGLQRPARPTRTPARSWPPRSRPFEAGEVDQVELVYTQFLSVGTQRVVIRRFMPIAQDAVADAAAKTAPPTALRPTTSSSPSPTPSSTGCCPAMPKPACSPPCSTPLRLSTPPASGP